MSTPKSVVKVIKTEGGGEIKITDNFDQTKYFIIELSRAAMRDVGKYIKRMWQIAYDNAHAKRTGKGRKATKAKVWASAKTKYPRVEVGLDSQADGFYSYFQEFGTSKTPREAILQNAVQDHIADIIRIESQYLSSLEGEASRLEAMIDEGDWEEDGDED